MRRGARVSAEALAAGMLGAGAGVMSAGVLADAVRLPISSLITAGLGVVLGASLFGAVQRASTDRHLDHPLLDLMLFAAIMVSVTAYVAWLAAPSLLPVADGPDIVHHLSLIHFVQRTHQLPHDPSLERYLGEMIRYTPGSHVLAAVIAGLCRVDALWVVHPVMAVSAGLKAALVFLIARGMLPDGPRASAQAVGATLLLFVPVEYFVRPIIGFGFYAQIVSETFAMGMLLAIVRWSGSGTRAWLIVFAASGVGALLAWPVWVPAGIAAVTVVTLIERRSVVSVRELCLAVAPIVAFGVLHVATHRGGASILGSSGVTTIPSWNVLGIGFVLLAAAGMVVGLRDRRARPAVAFAAFALLQAMALAAVNRWSGSPSLYLPYKMMYLVVPSGAALGGYVLARASSRVTLRTDPLGIASAVLPVTVATALMWGRAPAHRAASPIAPSAYAAGLWARDRLPAGCVDYLSRHWLTGYWLHLDVLGNPRVADRMRTETFEFRDVAAKWVQGRGMSYGIVEDIRMLPSEVRPDVEVLHRVADTAVVHDLRGTCPAHDERPLRELTPHVRQ